jgi:acetyltransferase-like isoleucine patch superfamily enzyme
MPVRKLLLAFVLLAPPWLKKWLLRRCFGAKIGRGTRIGWFALVRGQRVELGDYVRISGFAMLQCREVLIGDYTVIGSRVHVYGPASFTIGRHSVLGAETMVNVWEDVRIGDLSAVGARTVIVTHGTALPYTEGYWVKFAPVTIGSRVWVGSGVFIQPGITIGNEVFVNAMSVVKKDLPDGSVAEGYPAKVVAPMARLKRTMTPAAVDDAARSMLAHFAEVCLCRERGVAAAADTDGALSFRFHGHDYLVACVFSEGAIPANAGRRRVILLVNRPGWAAPPELSDAPVVDLTAMRTPLPRDPIHRALESFLRSYYSLPLEYPKGGGTT